MFSTSQAFRGIEGGKTCLYLLAIHRAANRMVLYSVEVAPIKFSPTKFSPVDEPSLNTKRFH